MKKIFLISFLLIKILVLNAQIIDSFPPVFLSQYVYIELQRNDTIFFYKLFPNKEKVDSIVYSYHAVRLNKNKWITDSSYSANEYRVFKIRKLKSKWFKENNGKIFQADNECVITRSWTYYPDGKIVIFIRIGALGFYRMREKNENIIK